MGANSYAPIREFPEIGVDRDFWVIILGCIPASFAGMAQVAGRMTVWKEDAAWADWQGCEAYHASGTSGLLAGGAGRRAEGTGAGSE